MNLNQIYNTSCKNIKFTIIYLISALIIILPQSVYSQSNSTQASIPMITVNNVELPSWDRITFGNMPTIAQSGSFIAPDTAIAKLGYNPSRTWNAGQTPDQYMMLGDFDHFKLQSFSLLQIANINGLDLQQINLNSFEPIQFQTIETLLKAIPSLQDISVSQVKPINDLISNNLSGNINYNISIGQLLKQSPILKKLKFNSLQLDKYSVNSIPGLSQIKIGTLKNWQAAKIAGVPGLNQVPFSKFPNPISTIGSKSGIVDIAFGTSEQQILRTVSGSDKQGFAVPCKTNCAHAELSGNPAIQGKAWISGKYNLVEGGHGPLGSVNGGKEPTGRILFDPPIYKSVIWDISEKDGEVSQAWFMRICMKNHFVDLGCTPYFIGPILIRTYKEKQPIFLGFFPTDTTASNSFSTPTGAPSNGNNISTEGFTSNIPQKTTNKLTSLLDLPQTDCSNKHNSSGVNIDALSTALSTIQGNYDFVGNYLCNSQGNDVSYKNGAGFYEETHNTVRVEESITAPPLPSETVLVSFPTHGYSNVSTFVIK